MLADLKMPGALEAVDGVLAKVDSVLAKVDSGAVTAGEAIEQVLGAQIALRNNRRAAGRDALLAPARPSRRWRSLIFTFQPSIKREQIESLHELGFLEPPRERYPARPAWGGQDASGDQPGESRPPRPADASTTARWRA